MSGWATNLCRCVPLPMRPSVCTNLHLAADVSVCAVAAARARRMHARARFMHGPRGVGVAVIVDGEVTAVEVCPFYKESLLLRPQPCRRARSST